MRCISLFVLGALLAATPLLSQNVNTMNPVEIQAQKHVTPDDLRVRASNVQFQKDVDELRELCSTVPGDMEAVKQGLLAKDLLEKLKRMEKISKRVREQLSRTPNSP